jgi:hypothetical protein
VCVFTQCEKFVIALVRWCMSGIECVCTSLHSCGKFVIVLVRWCMSGIEGVCASLHSCGKCMIALVLHVAFKKILIRETVSVRSSKEKIDVKVDRHGDVHCAKS